MAGKSSPKRALRYAKPEDMPEGMRRLYHAGNTGAPTPAGAAAPGYRPTPSSPQSGATGSTPTPARGRTRHVAGEMNKTERAYADLLLGMRQRGEILWFGFECWTFRLAKDTRYTPDFVVQLANGELQLIEVKGRTKGGRYFAEDDAKVKVKVAAATFPMLQVKVVWPNGSGGWDEEVVGWTEGQGDRQSTARKET